MDNTNTLSNKKTVKSTLRIFGETTTVKGVGRFIKTKNIALKLLWMSAVIFGLSFALFNIISLLLRYFEFGTVTNTHYCTECIPPFPDITVCNINSLSINTDNYDWSNYDRPPWTFNRYNQFIQELMDNSGLRLAAEQTLGVKFDDRNWTDIVGTSATITSYFQNLQKYHADRLRVELEERFIQECKFYDWDWKANSKIPCSLSAKTLRSFLNPEYLWCFTFDGKSEESRLKLDSTLRGLQSVIYLDNFGYAEMPVFQPNIINSKAIGVKVIIHPHGTLPDIKQGFNVAPGQEINVMLSAINETRLPDPHGNCTKQENLSPVDGFTAADNAELQTKLYTDDFCLSACYQAKMMQKCGCISPHHAITETMWQAGRLPFCQKADVQVTSSLPTPAERLAMVPKIVDTINRTLCTQTIELDYEDCDCQKPCSEITYEYKVFNTPWPHPGYEMALYNTLIKPQPNIRDNFEVYDSIGDLLTSDNSSDRAAGRRLLSQTHLIQDNFLQLNVYFQEKNVLIQQEKESVTVDMLYGSIGGNFNLWIGISFFTVIELCELLYKLCGLALVKHKQGEEEGGKDRVEAFVNEEKPGGEQMKRREAFGGTGS